MKTDLVKLSLVQSHQKHRLQHFPLRVLTLFTAPPQDDKVSGTGGSVHAYIHLPGRHEVCALSDPLKDLLQLGVDEGVV